MDMKIARERLNEMEECFTEAGFPVIREIGELTPPTLCNHLVFRSYIARYNKIVNIYIFVFPETGTLLLCLKFDTEVSDPASPELMELITVMNLARGDACWVVFETHNLIECRRSLIPFSHRSNKMQFGKFLKEFITYGSGQYAYVRRLLEKGESLSVLKSELIREIVLNNRRKVIPKKDAGLHGRLFPLTQMTS